MSATTPSTRAGNPLKNQEFSYILKIINKYSLLDEKYEKENGHKNELNNFI